MAKIFYQLRQNKNVKSKIYGKWFAHSKSVETMNTRKLSQHISEHGSIYTPDVVFGVLEKFRSCLLEMLLESKSVKIDGLGTFYTTLENEPGGADKEEDFTLSKNVEGVKLKARATGELMSKSLNLDATLKKATYVNGKLTESGNGGSGSSSNSGNNSGNTGGGGKPSSGDDDIITD